MTAPGAIALANSLRAAGRVLRRGPLLERLAVAVTVLATAGVAFLAALGMHAALKTAAAVLAQLPAVDPANLLERLLAGTLGGTFALLLLGSLTTAVSTLFLSEELTALVALPLPARTLLARQLALTAAAASAPTLLVALPAVAAGVRFAPHPALAGAALVLVLLALTATATVLGAFLALALVRFVPPRRARFAAAFLSAIGLSAALVGFRAARPERLLDPAAALSILEAIGATPAPPPRGPLGFAAHAAMRAVRGDPTGLWEAAALAAGALLLAGLAVVLLAPTHRRAWETAREAGEPARTRPKGRPARSLHGQLFRAELRTLLRDASTPAQLGTLSAVAALYLLNVRLLPGGDAGSRDLLLGLQTALALFLVGALALRFGYPAVSGDGRAALVLKSLPLSAGWHLLVRYAVRAAPALLLALALVGASAAALRPEPAGLARALVLAGTGALAIPALHVGLGALRPRYDAENPIAVALGPGGLLAIGLATLLAILAAPAASYELALLLGTLVRRPLAPARLLVLWVLVAAPAGALPLAAAARILARRDVPAS